MGCGASKKNGGKNNPAPATDDAAADSGVDASGNEVVVATPSKTTFDDQSEKFTPSRVVGGVRHEPRPVPAAVAREPPAQRAYTKHHTLEGAWQGVSAGGCVNFPSWTANPQFLLVPKPSERVAGRPVKLTIKLTQTYTPSDGGALDYRDDTPVGVYVFKSKENENRKYIAVGKNDLAGRSEFEFAKTVELGLTVNAGENHVLVPTYFDPAKEGTFSLDVVSDIECALEPIPEWHEKTLSLAWTEDTAGGCANNFTWRKNMQVELLIKKKPTRVTVQIEQENKGKENVKIGFLLVRADHPGEKVYTVAQDAVVGKTTFSPMPKVSLEVELVEEAQYIIIPSTFDADVVMPFTINIFSDEPVDANIIPEQGTWRFASTEGQWVEENAGGAINNDLTFRHNPRFRINCPSRKETIVLIYIEQDEQEGGEMLELGYYLFKQRLLEGGLLPYKLEADSILFRSVFEASPRIMTEPLPLSPIFGDEGLAEPVFDYIITPATLQPGKLGKFRLNAMYLSNEEMTIESMPQFKRYELNGSWNREAKNAGGCANYTSWTVNPHFPIFVKQPTAIHCYLTQSAKDDLLPIGMYILRKRGFASSSVGKAPFMHTDEAGCSAVLVDRPDGYLVCVATFEPNVFDDFSLVVYASGDLEMGESEAAEEEEDEEDQ